MPKEGWIHSCFSCREFTARTILFKTKIKDDITYKFYVHCCPRCKRSHKDIEKLQPYLHLPVQSGSDKVLKEMNRGYTFSDYMKIIDKTREYRPDIAVSGDFIVGFPGETKDDFEGTMNLINEVRFDESFSFIYSARPNTTASDMEDDVEDAEKKERLNLLQNRLNQLFQQLEWREGI